MATTLGSKAVGSVVKIKENGTRVNYLVVHQGKPSSIYDESCNGTWLLRQDIAEKRIWDADDKNMLETSDIHAYLNGTWLNHYETDIKNAIKQVKIPYRQNGGKGGADQNGANGLSCRIFPLSGYEVGFSTSDFKYLPQDGAKLAYFESGTSASAEAKRVAKWGGTADSWSLRSPHIGTTYDVFAIARDGDYTVTLAINSHGIRPAFVLPSNLLVNSDGTVVVNTPPAISGSTPSGSNLGAKEEGFDFPYTVTDVDGDAVTVKEYLDNTVKRSYQVALGQENTFEAVTAAHWQTVLNGSHTLKVAANDGKADSAPYTATFSKAVYTASITLAEPLPADALISVAVLSLTGSIPEDAALQVQLTNNGKDPQPVWEDATSSVKNGSNHVFANQAAANGFAFNFKVTVSRGPSGQGGHISKIGGAFQ